MYYTVETTEAEDRIIRDQRFEFEKAPKNKIEVIQEPKRWHPKFKAFKNDLISRGGFIRGGRDEKKRIAIHTSSELRLRALAIANAICFAATKRGCRVEVEHGIGPLKIMLDSATVEIRIMEFQPLNSRDAATGGLTGRLEVTVGKQLYGEGVIRDGDKPLEDQLMYVFAWLYEHVVTMNTAARKKAEWDAGYNARNAEFLRLVEQRKNEAANRIDLHKHKSELIEDAKKWQDASAVRAFVTSVMEAHSNDADPVLLNEWRDWALRTADDLDPRRKYAFVRKQGGAKA